MRKCENCGANLDSGERCDCERESDREKLDRACELIKRPYVPCKRLMVC